MIIQCEGGCERKENRQWEEGGGRERGVEGARPHLQHALLRLDRCEHALHHVRRYRRAAYVARLVEVNLHLSVTRHHRRHHHGHGAYGWDPDGVAHGCERAPALLVAARERHGEAHVVAQPRDPDGGAKVLEEGAAVRGTVHRVANLAVHRHLRCVAQVPAIPALRHALAPIRRAVATAATAVVDATVTKSAGSGGVTTLATAPHREAVTQHGCAAVVARQRHVHIDGRATRRR